MTILKDDVCALRLARAHVLQPLDRLVCLHEGYPKFGLEKRASHVFVCVCTNSSTTYLNDPRVEGRAKRAFIKRERERQAQE